MTRKNEDMSAGPLNIDDAKKRSKTALAQMYNRLDRQLNDAADEAARLRKRRDEAQDESEYYQKRYQQTFEQLQHALVDRTAMNASVDYLYKQLHELRQRELRNAARRAETDTAYAAARELLRVLFPADRAKPQAGKVDMATLKDKLPKKYQDVPYVDIVLRCQEMGVELTTTLADKEIPPPGRWSAQTTGATPNGDQNFTMTYDINSMHVLEDDAKKTP